MKRREYKKQYEALGKIINGFPPTTKSKEEIEQIKREILMLKEREDVVRSTVNMKSKNFRLLFHVLKELKANLNEEGKKDLPQVNNHEPPKSSEESKEMDIE